LSVEVPVNWTTPGPLGGRPLYLLRTEWLQGMLGWSDLHWWVMDERETPTLSLSKARANLTRGLYKTDVPRMMRPNHLLREKCRYVRSIHRFRIEVSLGILTS